jgi:di/tricarboxylate transporter
MTPISSPANTLGVGPGQYNFGDFVKLGVPFTIIVAIVSVVLVPIFLPFQ